MNDAKTMQVTESELLDNARAELHSSVEWFINCLEYGKGEPGAVWVRPDSDLSHLAALLTAV